MKKRERLYILISTNFIEVTKILYYMIQIKNSVSIPIFYPVQKYLLP